jgi:predicted  nucleic acid-binding Zn-ribbon protein
MRSAEDTSAALVIELDELEAEISRLRQVRERATYRLEQALRERDRLSRHLAATSREGSDV